MNGDGWWWPGFLIQLGIFIVIAMVFAWAMSWWLLSRVERRVREVEEREAGRVVGVGDVAGPPVGDSGGGPDE